MLNSFHASGDFCHQLITFANSWTRRQDQHKVSPDRDPKIIIFLKLVKKYLSSLQQKHEKLPSLQRVKGRYNIKLFVFYMSGSRGVQTPP